MLKNKELLIEIEKYINNPQFKDIYSSLLSGKKDKNIQLIKDNYDKEEIYDSWIYLIENYLSYIWCSKRYVEAIKTFLAEDEIFTILDFGAGSGFSTALLKECYPNATVYYYNISGYSKDYAMSFFKKYNYDIKVITELGNLRFDVIFISEVFEHIKTPIEVLKVLISNNNKYLIIANSFTVIAMGHFTKFIVDNVEVDHKKLGKLFNKTLTLMNYVKVDTNFWNDRPHIWRQK